MAEQLYLLHRLGSKQVLRLRIRVDLGARRGTLHSTWTPKLELHSWRQLCTIFRIHFLGVGDLSIRYNQCILSRIEYKVNF